MAEKLLRTSILAGFLILFIMLAGCGSGDLKVGDNRNGGAVEMHVGETMTVSLASNPTTGYGWTVQEVDQAVLQQQGEVIFTQTPASEGQAGSGGKEAYRFEALSEGQTTLVMNYHRAWETDIEPLETYTLTVIVR